MEIVKKLMIHVDKAEGTTYRDELLTKIIDICSQSNYQYITNFEWSVLPLPWSSSHRSCRAVPWCPHPFPSPQVHQHPGGADPAGGHEARAPDRSTDAGCGHQGESHPQVCSVPDGHAAGQRPPDRQQHPEERHLWGALCCCLDLRGVLRVSEGWGSIWAKLLVTEMCFWEKGGSGYVTQCYQRDCFSLVPLHYWLLCSSSQDNFNYLVIFPVSPALPTHAGSHSSESESQNTESEGTLRGHWV